MVDVTGTTSYTYDGLGRLTQASQPNGTTTYGYDLDSNRTTLGYPTVGTVTYFYSAGVSRQAQRQTRLSLLTFALASVSGIVLIAQVSA